MKNFSFLAALLFFSSITTPTSAQVDLQTCTNLVNQYCMTAFSGCFEGRTYQNVRVSEGYPTSANTLFVSGTVTFLDLFNVAKDNSFQALFVQKGNILEVYFSKYNTILGSSGWEECNRAFDTTSSQPTNTTATYNPQRDQQNREFIKNVLEINQQMVKSTSKW